MKDKSYKHKTKFLGIPVVGEGDRIWPEVELRKYQIIENLLLAGLKGTQNCIFDEGDMALETKEDGTFFAIMRPYGVKPTLEGMVGGAYFMVSDALVWENLLAGKIYYLYVIRTAHTFSDASSVRTMSSEYQPDTRMAVLIGVADLRDKPVLDRNPDGKVCSVDLAKHLTTKENPHGDLVQDEVTVRRKLVLGDGQGTDVVIQTGNERITVPVSCLVPSVVTFETKGEEGVIITSSARVAFVLASRVSGKTGNVGEISVGYYGQDTKVPNEQSFVVYNNGDAGIPMKALVYHG